MWLDQGPCSLPIQIKGKSTMEKEFAPNTKIIIQHCSLEFWETLWTYVKNFAGLNTSQQIHLSKKVILTFLCLLSKYFQYSMIIYSVLYCIKFKELCPFPFSMKAYLLLLPLILISLPRQNICWYLRHY